MDRIINTLCNASRIYNGKIDRLYEEVKEINENNDENELLILVANKCLELYLSGKIDSSFVDAVTDDLKYEIINTLRKNLKSNNTDIYELLKLEKEYDNNSIKLIKEYKKN